MPVIVCAWCNASSEKTASAINRAKKIGAPMHCNKECAGFSRRQHKTDAQKKSEKRLYDMQRREEKGDSIKEKKREYFKRTYDPAKAAIERKANMPRHVEYCRRPEYKKYKREYDKKHLANKQYGEFAEAFLALTELETTVSERATRYDIYMQNGTLNKKLTRRREYERINSNKS